MTDALLTYFQNAFSTPVQIVGQVVGFLAMLISLFAFAFVSRKKILATKLSTDVLWVVSFALCGAASGAVTNGVSAIRETVFYFKKESWKRKWYIPAAFLAFYAGSALLTWAGSLSLLPLIASVFSVLGLWASEPLHTKLWLFPALSIWLIYSLSTHSVMAAGSNVLSLISVTVGLFREWQLRRKTKKNQ